MKVNVCANGAAVKSWDTTEVESLPASVVYDMQLAVERKISKLGKKFKAMIPASVFLEAITNVNMVMAADRDPITGEVGKVDLYTKLLPLIRVVQELALPVGIVVASWGMIEIIVGNPSGKQKIKMSLIGYAGMFLIPLLFKIIHDTFS